MQERGGKKRRRDLINKEGNSGRGSGECGMKKQNNFICERVKVRKKRGTGQDGEC